MIPDFSGNFTNGENCPLNAVGVFIDEGEMRPGKFGDQLVITVEVNGSQMSHTFRNPEGRRMQVAYGKDTNKWIGKKFKITHIPYVNREKEIKQRVELIPFNEPKD